MFLLDLIARKTELAKTAHQTMVSVVLPMVVLDLVPPGLPMDSVLMRTTKLFATLNYNNVSPLAEETNTVVIKEVDNQELPSTMVPTATLTEPALTAKLLEVKIFPTALTVVLRMVLLILPYLPLVFPAKGNVLLLEFAMMPSTVMLIATAKMHQTQAVVVPTLVLPSALTAKLEVLVPLALLPTLPLPVEIRMQERTLVKSTANSLPVAVLTSAMTTTTALIPKERIACLTVSA
jgi:hypothetical protein